MKLDKYQKKCVEHSKGPAIIIAGPGSGKTKTMSERIAHLIQSEKIEPKKIVAISFTKVSAVELKERTVKTEKEAAAVNFGTFHGFFYQLLKGANLSKNIIMEYDVYKMVKQILKDKVDVIVFEEVEMKKIINALSIKINAEYFNDMCPEFDLCIEDSELSKLAYEYQKEKHKLNMYDFDDLILKTHELLTNNQAHRDLLQRSFSHFMIDEFQDINKAQYETIKLLISEENNICVVGDDDQSIYGFRGADPHYFLEFKKNFPGADQFFLSSNYRSKRLIVDFSQKIIGENTNRFEKEVEVFNKEEGEICLTKVSSSQNEAGYIVNIIREKILAGTPVNENAVIYRLNKSSRFIVDELIKNDIPFYIKDGVDSCFDSYIYKDIKDYILAAFERNNESLANVINKPGRYISSQQVKLALKGEHFIPTLLSLLDRSYQKEKVYDFELDLKILKGKNALEFIKTLKKNGYYDSLMENAAKNGMDTNRIAETFDTILDFSMDKETPLDFIKRVAISQKAIEESRKNDPKTSVLLTSIHGSKGLEFENVFIAACNDGIIPFRKAETPEEIEEERRMFYVAATRAKKHLVMTYQQTTGAKGFKRTPFLDFVDNEFFIKKRMKITK